MSRSAPPQLTAEEMQDAIRELAKGMLHYSCRVRVLELLVLEKELTTENELEKAAQRVSAQMSGEIGGGVRTRKKVSNKIQ